MKKTFLFKTLSMLIAFTLILSGFAGISNVKAADAIPVTGITLSTQTATIDTLGSVKLTAKIQPSNASNQEIVWETLDPAIARVTNGFVRGYAEGTTIVKATTKDQGKVAYCIITVKKTTAATPILNVRADDDNNGIPDFIIMTTPFTIEGRVSADFRVLSNNILTGRIYIQDSTAGIAVNGVTKALSLGSKVKLAGNVIYNNGETQFLANTVEIIGTSMEAVKPAAMSTKSSMLEEKEGLLVKIQGKVTKTSTGTIYVNDTTAAENEAKVEVGNYFIINTTAETASTVAAATTPSAIKIGDTVGVVGITTQEGTERKIVIRNEKDLTVITDKDDHDEDDKDDDINKSFVGLNKKSIVIKADKFEHVNILTKPGNAVISSVKVKTKSPIVTVTQDNKNKRLIKITPNKNIENTSQKLELEVVVNGKTYTLTLDVKVINEKNKHNNKGHK